MALGKTFRTKSYRRSNYVARASGGQFTKIHLWHGSARLQPSTWSPLPDRADFARRLNRLSFDATGTGPSAPYFCVLVPIAQILLVVPTEAVRAAASCLYSL